MIYGEIDIPNYFIQDTAAQVATIRKRIKEATIDIEVKWARGYLKVLPPF